MNKIRVIELFAGYGSQQLALKRLKHDYPDFDYEVVAFCEIDKHAITAYKALHGDHITNLGDVSKVDWAEWHKQHPQPIDLLTYSFPCTDISMAGRQEGLKEGSGTASSLLWECRRAISALRPRFAVMENVANLLSKHHKPEFDRWCREMEDMGYVNYCQILNAKDYNVPQNRRRVFMVSILGGERDYQFPAPMPLERPLKSLLERGVDEKYYIPDERVAILLSSAKLEKVTGGDPAVLGWTRDKKGEIVDRHPVDIANCVTACPRDNTSNYVLEQVFLNGDKDGCASTVTTTHDFAGNIVSPNGGHKQMGVKDNLLIVLQNSNNEQTRVFTDINEANTREVLRLLWQEVGTQTFCEKMGRLRRFQETQVLQQGVHEEGFCENGHDNTEQRHGSQLGETHSVDRGEQGESVCGVRKEGWQTGCASQGRELEEQFLGEFNDCLSQLPHETSQTEECMRYLRQADGRWTWLLQQTLSTLEEIRQSTNGERKNCQGIRIRRLSERELFRLMDVEDKDIDTLLGSGVSKTQLAKMAGNSIVVNVLCHIFRQLFVAENAEPKENEQLKLF